MSREEWKELYAKRRDEYMQAYEGFMYNSKNRLRCSECPDNEGYTSGSSRVYPCGQQNCWVDCHCGQISG